MSPNLARLMEIQRLRPAFLYAQWYLERFPAHSLIPHRDVDLDILGSLLHPEVQWAQCHNSAEVLDWYQAVLADGTRPTATASRWTATRWLSV